MDLHLHNAISEQSHMDRAQQDLNPWILLSEITQLLTKLERWRMHTVLEECQEEFYSPCV